MEEVKVQEAAPAVEVNDGTTAKFKETKFRAQYMNETDLVVKSQMLASVVAGNKGIQNSLEVIKFGVALAKAIDAAKADGKIDLGDLGQLFPVAPLVVPMIDGIAEVPKELGDLDDVEMEALLAEAAVILGSSGPETVAKIKAALQFARAGYDLYKAFA